MLQSAESSRCLLSSHPYTCIQEDKILCLQDNGVANNTIQEVYIRARRKTRMQMYQVPQVLPEPVCEALTVGGRRARGAHAHVP